MPRPDKGPRLYLMKAKDRSPMWVIRDGQRTRGTGCAEANLAGAEMKLAAYIAEHPEREPTTSPALIGVYLLMRKGRAVYVGSSLDMPNRVARHRSNGRPFDQVFYFVTKAEHREHLEAILIRVIRPAQNKTLPTKKIAGLAQVSAVLASAINGIAPMPIEDPDL